MPPAKDRVGIDVMFASDQRHGGARLERGFDNFAFELWREVGAATGSTGRGNDIQERISSERQLEKNACLSKHASLIALGSVVSKG